MDKFVYRKMKRKESGVDVLDDPSSFFVSAPATKIRRLDCIFPPMLEVEPEVYGVLEHQPPVEHSLDMKDDRIQPIPVTTEVGLPFMSNEDRSLVLYQPTESSPYSPLLNLPTPLSSGISFTVDSNLIASLKNQSLSRERISWNEVGKADGLAVVPWVPPPHLPSLAALASEATPSEPMEAEEMETYMEEDTETCTPMPVSSSVGGEVLQRQQHCMTPQPPHTTPVMSFW